VIRVVVEVDSTIRSVWAARKPSKVVWDDGTNGVLLILGTLLRARFTKWAGERIAKRIDAASTAGDVLVRSEAAKHRRASVRSFRSSGRRP
jgi:hypothetical protein